MVRVIGVERVKKLGHLFNRGPSKPLKLLTLDFILYVHVHALTRQK